MISKPSHFSSVVQVRRLVLLLCIMLNPASARDPEPPSARFSGSVRVALPNVDLPPSIPAPADALTLYADYAQADEGRVPLYLVNRTPKSITFSSQDNDIGIMLERRLPEGEWERVQSHEDSWCGNSYYPVQLDAGNHFAFSGYFPATGIPAQVRLRGYGGIPLTSNAGEGFFLEEDRTAAGLDGMALRQLPESLRSIFAYSPETKSLTWTGIADETMLSALRLTSAWGESRYVRRSVETAVLQGGRASRLTPDTAAAMREILNRVWPAPPQPQALITAALGELPRHPQPAWGVLKEFLGNGTTPGADFDARVVGEVKRALHGDSSPGIDAVANFLDAPRFADEHFDNAFFREWIRTPHKKLTEICARTLARRSRFEELAGIGSELEPASRPLILAALATAGTNGANPHEVRIRNPDSERESLFWTTYAREKPMECVEVLFYSGITENYIDNKFNLTLHGPLRQFLIRETNSPSGRIDGWELAKVVAFVGAWKREADIPLFRDLLNHPAYQKIELTRDGNPGVRFEVRRYRVREEARRVLLSMGQPVPADLVLESESLLP